MTSACTLCHVNLNRDALIVIREAKGHSKASLADAAGVDRTLITRLENGERKATPAVMRKLADALGIPLHALEGPAEVAA